MNLGLATNASTVLRADAIVLGEMDHRGSYDRGLPIGSSVGAMGSGPWGGQPTCPPAGWSAHPAHRVFSSISAPKCLTTVHSGFDRHPAHERKPSSLTVFFASFHCLSLNFSLTRVTCPRNRFPDMTWMVERGIKVRRYGYIVWLVAEGNFIRSAILDDKHAPWYTEKTYSEGFSLYDTYIMLRL